MSQSAHPSCMLCLGQNSMQIRLTGALYQKYCSTVHLHHAQLIDHILIQQPTSAHTHYQQAALLAQDQECMRRVYELEQYHGKIEQLTNYYKYNRELPRVVAAERQIEQYHRRMRNYDFKVVKAALKREQGVSITSQHDDSSFLHSQSRSKYSSVLHPLSPMLKDQNQESESILLQQLCGTLQTKSPFFDSIGSPRGIRGHFTPQNKQFQHFMAQHPLSNHNYHNPPFLKKHPPFLKQHLHQHDSRKQNHPPTRINLVKHQKVSKKSIEPTAANDTLSREEKSKKPKQKRNGEIMMNRVEKGTMKIGIGNMYRESSQPRRSLNSTVKVNSKTNKQKPEQKQTRNSHMRKASQLERPPSTARLPSNSHQDRKTVIHHQPSNPKPSRERQQSVNKNRASTPKHHQTSMRRSTSNTKSRSRLSRQNSREDTRIRLRSSGSVSTLKETNKAACRVQQLLTRKLALFGRA